MTRDKVLGILTTHRRAIRRMGVRRLALFGSVARNQSGAASDLDFLVEFNRNSFDSYMELKEFLESQFSCHVDLVLTRTLKPALREAVLKEAVHAAGL